MRKFSVLAAVLAASVGAFSTGAHAFRLTSGYHAPVLAGNWCYFGRADLYYGPAHPQANQFAHALSVAGNSALGCMQHLSAETTFQQTAFGHTYVVTDFCSFHPSCPVGGAGAIVVPDRSEVEAADILRLRQEFRVDEFDRRLRELLRLKSAED